MLELIISLAILVGLVVWIVRLSGVVAAVREDRAIAARRRAFNARRR
jgi:hypothetical protein